MAEMGPVEAATVRDLDLLPEDLRSGALAAAALAMAREVDCAGNSATSKSMCARAHRDALDRLREFAPPRKERDDLDDLAARRAKRRGAA